jgi:hypothetical protein
MLNNLVGIYGVGTPVSTNSYESISTVLVGSGGQSTISFTSIPSTYKHLQIRGFASPTTADVFMRFNGDANGNSNYARHFLYGDGATAAAGAATSSESMSFGFYSTTSGIFGTGVADILDYASTSKNKVARILSGSDANGSGLIVLYSGLRNSTAAITSIELFPTGGGSFRQYSSFALYGIKG